MPLCKNTLLNVGVFPIANHYYEPQFDFRDTHRSFSDERNLPGINWNTKNQLELTKELTFSKELEDISMEKTDDLTFYLNNRSFGSGDAEYWYQIIRLKKPNRIFEIGSGHSTLMAIKAIQKNKEEDKNYKCIKVRPNFRTAT